MRIKMFYCSVVNGGYSFEVEVDDELGRKMAKVIEEFDRKEDNYERWKRYHHALSLDGMEYDSITSQEEPISFLLERLATENALGRLTAVQRRRLGMEIGGVTRKEIAAIEGTTESAISETIRTAQKSMRKLLQEE